MKGFRITLSLLWHSQIFKRFNTPCTGASFSPMMRFIIHITVNVIVANRSNHIEDYSIVFGRQTKCLGSLVVLTAKCLLKIPLKTFSIGLYTGCARENTIIHIATTDVSNSPCYPICNIAAPIFAESLSSPHHKC